MKRITKIATVTLILGTSLLVASTDDYAITGDYKLLNDMRLAQKQQDVIVRMNNLLREENIELTSLQDAQNRFDKVLKGLINGDSTLNIKGTNLPKIKDKLNEVKELWDREKNILSDKKINKDRKDKAIANLNSIMVTMSEAITLYNKSYERFKQKSKISSIVNRHINNNKNIIFAFNTIQ
jgi:hypothetical protein